MGVVRGWGTPTSSPPKKEKPIMGRYAKSNQTIADLQKMIEDNGGIKAIVDSDKLKVRKDLLKIDVGHDVVGFVGDTYEMIGEGLASFPVAWCFMHDEDELPVEFVLYIGQEGNLRAYIPTHGNNVEGHRAISRVDAGPSKMDRGKMMDSVVNRISVKGASSCGSVGANVELTFRQIIQSFRDYGDQYASVMPHAKGAENPFWGIEDIWFENGVLNLGQTDDEGLTCDLIAERIEECVPDDLMDGVAVVRVGVTCKRNGKMELHGADGEVSVNHTVKSSEVKHKDDWFCKWILKYAS